MYRATRDGDIISDILKKIDGQFPTLFLIYTKKGIKCGGYTKALWKADSNYKYMIILLFYLILMIKKYLKTRIQKNQLFAMIICVLEIISIRIIISEITFFLKKFMKLYQNIAIIVMAMMFREKMMLTLMN